MSGGSDVVNGGKAANNLEDAAVDTVLLLSFESGGMLSISDSVRNVMVASEVAV